jgi:hypothetical protein
MKDLESSSACAYWYQSVGTITTCPNRSGRPVCLAGQRCESWRKRNSIIPMNAPMAIVAKCYQVVLGILAGLTPESSVVYFKVGHCAACLAPPSITSKYSIAKLFVRLGSEP